MSEIDKPKIEHLAAERALWDTVCERKRAKGFDVARDFVEWATITKQELDCLGARKDFTELCAAG
jgi:hypothetical protein